MDIWVEVLLDARVRPGAWNLVAVDLWVEVLQEARVRPGAWNLGAVDLWVDVLLEGGDVAWCWEDKGAYSLQ